MKGFKVDNINFNIIFNADDAVLKTDLQRFLSIKFNNACK